MNLTGLQQELYKSIKGNNQEQLEALVFYIFCCVLTWKYIISTEIGEFNRIFYKKIKTRRDSPRKHRGAMS